MTNNGIGPADVRHALAICRAPPASQAFISLFHRGVPARALKLAAPLRPLPGGIADLDHFRIQRRDRAGVIHEYRLVA